MPIFSRMLMILTVLLSGFAFANANAAKFPDAVMEDDPQTLAAVAEVFASIETYLPYKITASGNCPYRNMYLLMELLVRDVPTRPLVASACSIEKEWVFKSRTGDRWGYHVTPAFLLSQQPYVLDPMFAKQPLQVDSWLKLLNTQSVPYYTFLNHRESVGKYADPQRCHSRANWDIADFTALAFDSQQIPIACQFMWADIGLLRLSAPQKAQMRANLVHRTEELTRQMMQKNRIQSLHKTHQQWEETCSLTPPKRTSK